MTKTVEVPQNALTKVTQSQGLQMLSDKQLPPTQRAMGLVHIIEAQPEQFKALGVPDVKRFAMVSRELLLQNPSLMDCNIQSLMMGFKAVAMSGLSPLKEHQECYIIPRGGQAVFQIGYKGQVALLMKTGAFHAIQAYAVYANDEFELEYGLRSNIIHRPYAKGTDEEFEVERGTSKGLVGAYAVARFKEGEPVFRFISKGEIERAKAKSTSGSKGGQSPWNTDYMAMAEKTAVHRLVKLLPREYVPEKVLKATLAEDDDTVQMTVTDDGQVYLAPLEAQEAPKAGLELPTGLKTPRQELEALPPEELEKALPMPLNEADDADCMKAWLLYKGMKGIN